MRLLTLSDLERRYSMRSGLLRNLDRHRPITSLGVDSRGVKPGQLFFALKGEHVDGHAFLHDVLRAGAIGAVVSKSYQGSCEGLPLFAVDDVLEALQNLARDYIRASKSLIVAVTGSLGKTTTKEFLGQLLSQRYRTAVSPGNQNSQIGLPLAICNHTNGSEEVLVLEMGMTLPGQISQLIAIAPPDVALITSVALAHAGNFDGLEAIGRAKAEIFGSPKTSVGLLPLEVIDFQGLCQTGPCRKKAFSIHSPEADYFLKQEEGDLIVSTAGEVQNIGSWQIPGAHNRHNLLAAIAVARELKVTWEEIANALPRLALPERRFQRIEKHGVTFMNDSYNAPPLAVQAALANLPSPQPGGRRIAVLGPMPELGQFSASCHREVGELALDLVDEMFCLGHECQPIYDVWQAARRPVSWFMDRQKLLEALDLVIKPGDVVLIKGANIHQMWRLVEEWEREGQI